LEAGQAQLIAGQAQLMDMMSSTTIAMVEAEQQLIKIKKKRSCQVM
jgi:hypothetical protein